MYSSCLATHLYHAIMTISFHQHRVIEHGRDTALLLRSVAHHLAPDLIAFHAEVNAGPGITTLHDLTVNMLVEFNSERPEIAQLVIHTFDEFMVKNF